MSRTVGLQRASRLQADGHPPIGRTLPAGRERHAGAAATALLARRGAAALRVSSVVGVAAPGGVRREPQAGLRALREEGLSVRRRKRKRMAGVARVPTMAPERPNQRRSMDFVSDALASGRRIRVLTVMDDFTRESLAMEVDTSLPGLRVTRVLDRLAIDRGLPDLITVDNGPEFAGRVLDAWAYTHGVHLHFIEPGQARTECVHRELQRAASRRVPQRALVHELVCSPDHRGELSGRLQCRPAPQRTGQPNARGVRTTGG